MENEFTKALRLIVSASVVIGGLPAKAGTNGSVLLMDDEEASRIEGDLDRAVAMLEKLFSTQ